MKTSEFVKRELLLWLAILAPLVFALIRWNDFPERIPVHWGIDGEPNRWTGKWGVFLSPVINLLAYFMLIITPRIDPRKKNYDLFSGSYFMIRSAITLLLSLVGFITLLATLGVQLNVGLILMNAVLVLLVFIGNLFGKVRPNFFVGIRTPWTLSSEEVWMKTHRLAGRLWVIGSLLMFIPLWILSMKITAIVFVAYILVLVLVPFIYSYKLHKSVPGRTVSNK